MRDAYTNIVTVYQSTRTEGDLNQSDGMALQMSVWIYPSGHFKCLFSQGEGNLLTPDKNSNLFIGSEYSDLRRQTSFRSLPVVAGGLAVQQMRSDLLQHDRLAIHFGIQTT